MAKINKSGEDNSTEETTGGEQTSESPKVEEKAKTVRYLNATGGKREIFLDGEMVVVNSNTEITMLEIQEPEFLRQQNGTWFKQA